MIQKTYAIVVDTRFTQPPHEFTVGIGIERIEFNVNPIDQATFLASLLFEASNSSDFSLASINAPYSHKSTTQTRLKMPYGILMRPTNQL